ncbi:MAG: sigma-70 family RNA polymerase sigma factor [Planctomycetes bacterium]|nr:sigma-70 family RNA polymerase sigma factor [Planctomycetota bacterium]
MRTGAFPDVARTAPTGMVGAMDALDQETAVRGVLSDEPRLVGYVRAIVGDRSTAEDVFQDLVMLVMRKHADIPDLAALAGWTRRAARFLALKALEKRARERPVMDSELLDLLDGTWEDGGHDHAGAPYLEALRQCCAALPPHAQELIALKYTQGISGQEIATRLGRPLNTVYVTLTRLHRGLEACVRARLRRSDA